MALRIRRGTDAERQTITPAEGELVYTTDTKELFVGDGLTQGGNLVSAELSDDTTPSLGGDLNLNGHNIVGTGNINITGTISATGNINLGDGVEDNVIVGGQISSSLIPGTNNAYDLGSPAGNWRHVYSEGATVDGALIAGSILTGDILGQDSSVVYDSTTGALTVSSVVAASFTGDLTGSVFSDDSSLMVDSVNKSILARTINSNRPLEGELVNAVWFGDNNTPASIKIHAEKDALAIFGLHDGFDATTILGYASRGTLENPETLQIGDTITGISAFAHDGADYQPVGGMAFFVSNIDGGEMQGGVGFIIPKAGSGGSQFWEFAFTADGNASLPGNITSPGIVSAAEFEGDLSGSVFADNSTKVVDGLTGEIVNLAFRGQTGNTPSDTGTVDSWLEVTVNGATKYIPLYD